MKVSALHLEDVADLCACVLFILVFVLWFFKLLLLLYQYSFSVASGKLSHFKFNEFVILFFLFFKFAVGWIIKQIYTGVIQNFRVPKQVISSFITDSLANVFLQMNLEEPQLHLIVLINNVFHV